MGAIAADVEVTLWLSASLRKIPPISPLASRLLTWKVENDEAFEQLENIIASDPGLSARILGLANSAYFGSGGRVCLQIRDALQRLGLQQSWQTSVGFLFGRSVSVSPELERIKELLWLHSYATGACAREFANASDLPNIDPEMVFLGGFLHDIGYLAIIALEPTISLRLLDIRKANPTSSQNPETSFGLPDHVTVGSALCELWGLPEPVRELIAHHQVLDPFDSKVTHPANLVAVLLGHRVAMELLESDLPTALRDEGPSNEQLCADLGITPAKFTKLIESLGRRIEAIEAAGKQIAQ